MKSLLFVRLIITEMTAVFKNTPVCLFAQSRLATASMFLTTARAAKIIFLKSIAENDNEVDHHKNLSNISWCRV